MPAASEENAVVTNGMSLYKRDGVNANSAVLCEVRPSDFGGETPLAGVEFQRRLEKSAYLAGGGEYRAPVQLLGDYIKNRTSEKFGAVIPTYARGCSFYDLNKLLTEDMNSAIKKGVADFDRRLKGFMKYDAVLTGIESRSSSPLRILRTDNLCGVNVTNLYPCGEGCGYAGGIMSAAVDGIRVALKIIEKYL